jgi:hypothetical protein
MNILTKKFSPSGEIVKSDGGREFDFGIGKIIITQGPDSYGSVSFRVEGFEKLVDEWSSTPGFYSLYDLFIPYFLFIEFNDRDLLIPPKPDNKSIEEHDKYLEYYFLMNAHEYESFEPDEYGLEKDSEYFESLRKALKDGQIPRTTNDLLWVADSEANLENQLTVNSCYIDDTLENKKAYTFWDELYKKLQTIERREHAEV